MSDLAALQSVESPFWSQPPHLRKYQHEGALWLNAPPSYARARILADAPGFGKRLWTETPIPTPAGWSRMGELRVGDVVFDEQGHPTTVVGVSPIEVASQTFRVTFSDHSELVADAEHLWLTCLAETLPVVRTTREIRDTLYKEGGKRCNHSIATCGPLQCAPLPLPIEPYTLGLWLGNGTSEAGEVCIQLSDVEFIVAELSRVGWATTVRGRKSGSRIVTIHKLRPILREQGLLKNKHVPLAYLRASVEQRSSLLMGLMDTNGTVSKRGHCCFDNTNRNLAEAAYDLVCGLGGKATTLLKHPKITDRPEAICADCFRVTFTPTHPVFRLPRKLNCQVDVVRPTQHWRYITAIKPAAPVPMRCIAVSSPSGLYLAGKSYIPTHNTSTALAAARFEVDSFESKCILVFTTSISRFDWRREASRFWPELETFIVSVDQPKYQRKRESDTAYLQRREGKLRELLHGAAPALVICNYEMADYLSGLISSEGVVFDRAFCDEIHTCKYRATERSKTMRPLIGRTRKISLLTGTPIHNRAIDLHTLLDFCALGRFGSKWTLARKYFRIINGLHGQAIGELVDKEGLRRDTSDLILARSVAEAYGELPARIRELKRIEVDTPIYRVSREAARKLKEGGAIDKALRKAAEKKLAYAADFIAEELHEPVVAYTIQRDHAAALQAKLQKLKVSSILATGETIASVRAQRIEDWKAGGARVLVCTMDAVRESATLTRAAVMVFLDLDWLPGKQLQCEGRIDPARQPENERRPVRYYYLVIEGGPDEVVAERVIEKLNEAQGLIGDNPEANRLVDMLKSVPGKAEAAIKETPEQAMSDLISRIETRAARMAEMGFLPEED